MLLKKIKVDSLVVVGGDTLRAILEKFRCRTNNTGRRNRPPVSSLVKSKYCGNDLYLVSKSGGFGTRTTHWVQYSAIYFKSITLKSIKYSLKSKD
ncbi:MAG: hypothetical protein ACOX1A_00390 [Saccharofermentanales bacterium]